MNSIKFRINNDLLNFVLSEEGKFLLNNDKNVEIQQSIILKIATFYKDTYFYLPTHADWRGRIYTHSMFITYQGSDLSSSLLLFDKGEILNNEGRYYLYIYGANAYNENNISKAPFFFTKELIGLIII